MGKDFVFERIFRSSVLIIFSPIFIWGKKGNLFFLESGSEIMITSIAIRLRIDVVLINGGIPLIHAQD